MEFLKTPWGIALQIVLVIAAVAVNSRLIFSYLINKAIRKGDRKEYWNLLNSRFANIFIGENRVELLKAVFQANEGSVQKASQLLDKVIPEALDINDRSLYVQLASTVAINTKDARLFTRIGEVIDSIVAQSEGQGVESMKDEYSLMKRLYFEFDESVIPELEEKIAASENIPAKGMLQLMLAKAYHLSGTDKKAAAELKKAKEALAGSEYESYIAQALKDLSVLDN